MGVSVEKESVSLLWETLLEASQACNELMKCGCESQCAGHCSCIKANLPCTELCKCSGGCYDDNHKNSLFSVCFLRFQK